jgi:uncharacterized membrane protein YjjB (DUF3815 family)
MREFPTPSKETAGRILIWLGVLAWVPYLVIVLSGNRVSIFPFLAVHLIGVIGGIRLRGRRTTERRKLNPSLHRFSWILIYLGVLAWAPYIYQNNILGNEIPITPYLTAHLTGILGGGLLRLRTGS